VGSFNRIRNGIKERSFPCSSHLLWTFLVVLCQGCGGSGGSNTPSVPPPAAGVDWKLAIDTNNVVAPLAPAVAGFYDLSGVLLDYQNVPGLVSAMASAGFAAPGGSGADWRIGLGRWEISTERFGTLTDGTACPGTFPNAQSSFATDLDLIASRDWFSYTDGSLVGDADINDSRYALDYARSVIDDADIFGATPFVSIDNMPRALSINQTPNRLDCDATFTNSVSNNEPADPVVFAKAVAGLVERVVEGTGTKTGNDRPRSVTYWEVWNEPEAPQFWEPTLGADPDSFFNMAIPMLMELDAYRSSTIDPAGQGIKIGLAGFVNFASAIATVNSFDGANIPLDFISFHAYNDDPLFIVDAIVQTEAAIRSSTDYQDAELVLGEWGPNLATRAGDQQYAMTMDPALHAATVVALGAIAGLDRSHNAIIYDFFPAIALGLIDNSGTPRYLYRAYELMTKLTAGNAERLDVQGFADGRLDSGQGAVLVSRDSQSGTLRVLLVNRNNVTRTVSVVLDGTAATPTQIFVIDESADPASSLPMVAVPTAEFQLPARSVAVAEF
jgi:hypothetical protein